MAKKSIQKVKVTSFTNKIWLLQIKSDVQKLERLPRRIINRNTGWQYWHCQASKGNLEHALKTQFTITKIMANDAISTCVQDVEKILLYHFDVDLFSW